MIIKIIYHEILRESFISSEIQTFKQRMGIKFIESVVKIVGFVAFDSSRLFLYFLCEIVK